MSMDNPRSSELRARAGDGRDVIITLLGPARATRVYLESLPAAGPAAVTRAVALLPQDGGGAREYRAVPPSSSERDPSYVPVAVFGADEVRGQAFRLSELQRAPSAAVPRANAANPGAMPPPALDLIAHVEADLPRTTVFGPTPEGIRIAFYITHGQWHGPRVHARYKSEGGDWLLVREDGVAIPNLRSTLETDDGALLYYQLTGTVDLGPDGYARTLARDLPALAPIAVVAQVSTSSERWSWLNRTTLVGTGIVNLKEGRVLYDVYSLRLAPNAT
jgi:hypothetical protein